MYRLEISTNLNYVFDETQYHCVCDKECGHYYFILPYANTRRVCVNVVGDLKQLKKVLTLNNNVKNWASRKDIKNYRFEILVRRIVICT